MATKAALPTPPYQAWLYSTVAVVLGAGGSIAALVFGWPGLVLLWVGVIAAGWLSQTPTMTGPTDASKRPTAANPAEAKGMSRFQFWSQFKWRPAIPNKDWLPVDFSDGFPKVKELLASIMPSWVFAMFAGLLAASLPTPQLPTGRLLDAIAVFALVVTFTGARRRTAHATHPRPVVTIKDVLVVFAENKGTLIGYAVTACAASIIFGMLFLSQVPTWQLSSRIMFISALVPCFVLLVATRPILDHTLSQWRGLCEADEMWTPRWEQMKMAGAPFIYDHVDKEVVTIDTFRASAMTGAGWFFQPKSREQLVNSIGAGARVDVLTVPNTDAQGQPQPGTIHPLDVRIVIWQTGAEPDYASADTDPELVSLALECAMSRVADEWKIPRPILDSCQVLNDTSELSPSDSETKSERDPESSRVLYQVTWFFPEGGTYKELADVQGSISAHMQCGCVVDDKESRMFVGDFDAAPASVADRVEYLATRARWSAWWKLALKETLQPPFARPELMKSARLATKPSPASARAPRIAPDVPGTEIWSMPFTVGGGYPLSDFVGHEAKMLTATGFRFFSVTGFVEPNNAARGERHNSAFTAVWSEGNVPVSPQALIPDPTGKRGARGAANMAQQWALVGMVNKVFDAAGLKRPQIIQVFPMTAPESDGHIWGIKLRLYDGVTTPQVRSKMQVFAQTWGCPWVRIAPGGEEADTLTLFAGAQPSKVILANPERDEFRITGLDWDQAWQDSLKKGLSPTGAMPTLTQLSKMEHNSKVSVLDFDIPPGIGLDNIKEAVTKLRTSTGNAFIQFQPGTNGAASVRILVSPEDPVPFPALYDFEYMDTLEGEFAFATGVDGEPVSFIPQRHVHALIAGMTGGGKSVTLQALLYNAAIQHNDIYVGDPVKGAADFKFIEPYAKAVTVTLDSATAMMKLIYDEVLRRKNTNSQHGVGSYKDLPDDVRPRQMLVVIDEFTSLMIPDNVPAETGNSEVDAERAVMMASNEMKASIGSLVGRIAREARSAGVVLILATQKLNAKTLDSIPGNVSDLKTNLSRMVLGKATFPELSSALKDASKAPDLGALVPPGRGLWEPSDGEPTIIQAWYEPREQERLAEELAKRLTPVAEYDKADLGDLMPPPVEQYGIVEPEDEVIDLGEMSFDLGEVEPAPVEVVEHDTVAGSAAPFADGVIRLMVVPDAGSERGERAVVSGTDDTVAPFDLEFVGDQSGWWVADSFAALLSDLPVPVSEVNVVDCGVQDVTVLGLTRQELFEDVCGGRVLSYEVRTVADMEGVA